MKWGTHGITENDEYRTPPGSMPESTTDHEPIDVKTHYVGVGQIS
jgi:hypothetical protein